MNNFPTVLKDCSLSHGTLRPQDLIPVMMSALRVVDCAAYEQLLTPAFPLPPAYAREDDDADWWGSEDCAEFFEELYALLNYAAPEGYYFGSHPGDGSDFGFWEYEDDD